MTTPNPLQITELLTGLKLLLGLVIVALAAYGYRRNSSQPMFFVGSGIAMMTLVSPLATVISSIMFSVDIIAPLSTAIEIIGMCLILYSIALARRK